ncbi:Oxygen sensor histidine kinase NreB [Rosistilla carotiformis]|uniref:Oxygen sensor histidine kinase NreB n=1 Tax=Rosistilla carotiformis TaxID=2528017 RepID=A0A518JUI3_9BACT|nr:ABC transporter substrate binding protein [Rosistilla carotiformis]QDV69203.1 Oxygen sensor histidine kinase NreB [Rosistilla carotiformis]
MKTRNSTGSVFRCIRWATLVAAGFISIVGTSNAAGDTQSDATPSVVVFYSFRHVMPVNVDWDRGIRNGLASAGLENIRIEVEYLDLDRYSDDDFRDQLVDLLEHKYANRRIDVVIPVYTQAIDFVLAQRTRLFPNVPLVCCTAKAELAARIRKVAEATGTEFEIDYWRTVQDAKRLFPRMRKLYLIGGVGETDRHYRRMAHRALDDRLASRGIEIIDVEGLPIVEMKQFMAQADRDGVALLLTCDEDRDGNHPFTVDVSKQLCADCPVPVFGTYDTLIGTGVVGGHVWSIERHGELAGQLASRIIAGEDVAEIPLIGLHETQSVFDARQLNRWKIDTDALPTGSKIRFAEASIWDLYRSQIVLGIGLLSLQTLIIAGLIVNRSRRIKAERSLFASRGEARNLAGRLLSAQEDERRRLARELHDDLSQRLAASAIGIGQLELGDLGNADSRARLKQMKEDLIGLSDDVHQMSYQIHPSILEDLGLEDAIRSACDRLARRDKIDVEFRCGMLPDPFSDAINLCLYRVAQESLWNAARHAETQRIDVVLTADPETVNLEIRDFGVGFDSDAALKNGGLGLASLHERARIVGGDLSIAARRGSGTTITLSIPLLDDDR